MIRIVNQIWLFAGVAPGCDVRKAFVLERIKINNILWPVKITLNSNFNVHL